MSTHALRKKLPIPPAKLPKIETATRTNLKERIFLYGSAGSGKTKTALRFAEALREEGTKIGLVDTEYGRARNHSKDHVFLTQEAAHFGKDNGYYHPDNIVSAVRALEQAGCSVIIVDSLSDAWEGPGGIASIQSALCEQGGKYKNSQAAWGDAKLFWKEMLRGLAESPAHIIVTLKESQDLQGNPKPVGERRTHHWFDLAIRMEQTVATILKSEVADQVLKAFELPGEAFIQAYRAAKGFTAQPTAK